MRAQGRVAEVPEAERGVLARWAQALWARPAQLRVTGASGLLERMWRLLALHEVAPVTFTAAHP